MYDAYSAYEPFYRDLIRHLSERFPPPVYSGSEKRFRRESYLSTAAGDVIELLVTFADVSPSDMLDVRWWEVCFLRERGSGISKAGIEVLSAEAKVLETAIEFTERHRFDYGVIL